MMDSRQLFKIPGEKHSAIDFRWLSYENRIPVNPDILFTAIPKGAQNPAGGKSFLLWLYKPEIQQKLFEINHFKRLEGISGIAGGFSALKEVNQTALPQHFPLLTGRIPASDTLVFPQTYPDNYRRLRDDGIIPWIINTITLENFEKTLQDQLNFFEE